MQPNLFSVGAVSIQKSHRSPSKGKKAARGLSPVATASTTSPRRPIASMGGGSHSGKRYTASCTAGSRKRQRNTTGHQASGVATTRSDPPCPPPALSQNPLHDPRTRAGPVIGGHPRLEFISCAHSFDPRTTAIFRDSSGAESRSKHSCVRTVGTTQRTSSRLLVMPPTYMGQTDENGEARTTVFLEDSRGRRHGPMGNFTYIDGDAERQRPERHEGQDPPLFNQLVDFVRTDLLRNTALSPTKRARLAGLLEAGAAAQGLGRLSPAADAPTSDGAAAGRTSPDFEGRHEP